MTSGRYGLVLREVGRLLSGGTVAALGEGQLLERFAAKRDATAFEALVSRHGPMVLGTCRRMLADPRDVEDAFQATFLVLARRAGSIRDADRLGPWLHGVARRVAARSRALSARRKARERPGGEDLAVEAPDASEAAELRAVLDEELARLPEKYRAPLVLCYLEGLTHDEAAQHLRWPVGTVRSRLAGGRDRLRARLTRRGLAPTAAVPAILPQVSIPQALLSTTVRIATSAGSAPAHVATLAKGALVAMIWNKLKTIAAVGLMAGLTVGGASLAAQRGAKGPANVESAPAEKQIARNPDEKERLERELADSNRKLEKLRIQVEAAETEWKQEATRGEPDSGSRERMTQLRDYRVRRKKEIEETAQIAEELTARLHQFEQDTQVSTVQELAEKLVSTAEGLQENLEAANKEIKRLEAELRSARTVSASLQRQLDAARARIAFPPTTSEGTTTAVDKAKPGRVMVPDATKPNPATDADGGANPQAPHAMVMTVPGDRAGNPMLLAVISGEQDRVTIISSETQKRATFRIHGGATAIVPMSADNVVALMVKGQELTRIAIFDRASERWLEHDLGQPATRVSPSIDGGFGGGSSGVLIGFSVTAPEVRRLVVFDASKGTWPEQELREPAKGAVRPKVTGKMVIYSIGRFLYIYSAPAQKWSVLELRQEMSAKNGFGGGPGNPTFDVSGRMVVPDGDLIHTYDPKTGEWIHIDTKDEK